MAPGTGGARRLRLLSPHNLCDRAGLGSKGQRLAEPRKEQTCEMDALGNPKGRESTIPEGKLSKGEDGLSSDGEHRH